MAENKKSFILYADQVGVFEKLTDVKAGKLIKIIFAYVNDKNPTVEDTLLHVAFDPIKLQLKRDLRIWEAERSKRSAAGKKGGINSGKSRRAGSKRSSALKDEAGASKNEANEADNVNVNVNASRMQSAEFFELFKRAASPLIPDEVLWQEVQKLMEKYPGKIAKRSIPLINTWVSNIVIPKPEVRKMVH